MLLRQGITKFCCVYKSLNQISLLHITPKVNALNLKPFPPEIAHSSENHFLKKKFDELVLWYEQLTGMDEVRIMQNRVIEAQDRFAAAQEKRRTMSNELNKIQSKLKEIYSELDTTTRGEERYLQLITQEHAILKEERRLTAEFSLVEREERDSFTHLSSCVKESHEKERAQAERTKYWSIIGSIIGTILGIAGSSINNEFKMRELRKLVKDLTLRDSMSSSDLNAAKILSHHQEELTTIVAEMKSALKSHPEQSGQGAVLGNIDRMLHTISSRSNSPVEESVRHIERKVEDLKEMITSSQRYEGQLVAIPTDLELLIQKQSRETRFILIGVSVCGILLPILISCLQR